MQRRNLLASSLAALALGWVTQVRAAEPPRETYAVVSLIGEELNLIAHQPAQATRLDMNRRSSVTLADAGFDAAALGSLEQLLKEAEGQPRVLLYRLKSPRLSARPSLLYNDGRAALPPVYVEAMKQDGVTRVLLLTRYRRPALFPAMDGANAISLGGGYIEGLGFYADGSTMMQNRETKHVSTGFLAPFVSLHLAMIDLASGSILASRTAFEATTLSAAGPQAEGSENAWTALPEAERAPFLNRMIRRAMERNLPLLLKGVSDGMAVPQS